MTEMVGLPGSLYFKGDLHCKIALSCSVKKAFLFTVNPLLIVHKSFRNSAYVGTCLIISSSGILTFTCLNTSRISAAFLIPFFPCNAWGKGGDLNATNTPHKNFHTQWCHPWRLPWCAPPYHWRCSTYIFGKLQEHYIDQRAFSYMQKYQKGKWRLSFLDLPNQFLFGSTPSNHLENSRKNVLRLSQGLGPRKGNGKWSFLVTEFNLL